jgi:RimJ/RimL family protein N-acetyltransferase
MITVAPYTIGDEQSTKFRERTELIDISWAWTVYKDGEICAIVGCSDFYPQVGHLYAHVSDSIRGCGTEFTRKMKKLLNMTFREKKYHRIQAFCDSNNAENGKWLELLGLKYEATMKKCSPDGRDINVHARVI